MHEVTIYGTTHCPKCQLVKKCFTSSDIKFNFVNLDEHPELLDDITAKVWPNSSLPIIQCGDKYHCVANVGDAFDFYNEVKGDSCNECD